MAASRQSVVRWITTAVSVLFIGVLVYYLVQPGYSWTRLAFFAGLGGLAVLGTMGIMYQRELVAVGGACGLLLVGFWQAVLWLYIVPVVGVLVVAAIVSARDSSPNTPSAG